MSGNLKTIFSTIGKALLKIPRFFVSCISFVRTHTWTETKDAFRCFLSRVRERYLRIKTEMHRKHRFVVMDSETFREKWSFQLSGINLFVTIGISVIVLIVLTSLLIAFTSLREFIPGYTRSEIAEISYQNTQKLDSLEHVLTLQEMQLQNIKVVLGGGQLPTEDAYRHKTDTSNKVQPGEYIHSKADSLLREEVENTDQYQVKPSKINKMVVNNNTPIITYAQESYTSSSGSSALPPFFTPLHGDVVKSFNEKKKHFGTDVSGVDNSVIKSAYSGTILLATFTPETGYVIAIQHPTNYISVYKHCGSLLKRAGDVVRAGEPVAFLGSSPRSDKLYLHFELWNNGKPLNPESYVNF